jgi:alanyl-tRNA synthetase
MDGVKVVVDKLEAGDIKNTIDELKNQNENIAIMLFQIKDDKVLIASGIKGNSLKAGEWVKTIAPILKGGGGGRDDFAQAGGKDPSKIDEAIEKSIEFVKSKLK